MGDPRHIPGLSYNVGTCQASGVSSFINYPIHMSCYRPPTNHVHSSHLAQQASSALQGQRFNPIVMLLIRTAAMATMLLLTRATEPSMARPL